MAVNLQAPDTLLPIAGVRLASVNAGIRYKNRNDVLLIELDQAVIRQRYSRAMRFVPHRCTCAVTICCILIRVIC